LDETTEIKNSKSLTQVASKYGYHSLLSLPYLLARRTYGREPLVDYSQSHVVTSKCCNFKRVFEDYAIKCIG
jgi:hypothetical protein